MMDMHSVTSRVEILTRVSPESELSESVTKIRMVSMRLIKVLSD